MQFNGYRDDLNPTVEEVLEMALLRAGFLRRENFGHFEKVKWTRSSRTDKSVHALAAVVAFNSHCKADAWADDPEGIAYAEAVNRGATSVLCLDRSCP